MLAVLCYNNVFDSMDWFILTLAIDSVCIEQTVYVWYGFQYMYGGLQYMYGMGSSIYIYIGYTHM